jgi:hypothetical protein
MKSQKKIYEQKNGNGNTAEKKVQVIVYFSEKKNRLP